MLSKGPVGARGEQVQHCSVLGLQEILVGDEGALPATPKVLAGGTVSLGLSLAAVTQGWV